MQQEKTRPLERPAEFCACGRPLTPRGQNGHVVAQPTYDDFRLSPFWDPLRNDPRFTALVQKLAPLAR